MKITTRHKIRLFLGIHGEIEGYGYCFNCIPSWLIERLPVGFQKWWWNILMFRYISPLLNKIIGYTPGDWKK